MSLLLVYAVLTVLSHCDALNDTDYFTKRLKILHDEALLTLGGKTTLTDKETIVNNCLMQHKFHELDYCFDNPEYFNLSHHYFVYKDNIRKSKVYKILKDMPKGAALHVHDMALLGADYIMNITYMQDLYVCFGANDMVLRFANSTPSISCEGPWQRMSDARASSGNITKFNENLRKHFTVVVNDPDVEYPSIRETWRTFKKYFSNVYPLLSYRPNWEQYFYDALKKFREDNIMYVELRSVLPQLYELDGTVYDPLITAKAYSRVIKRFVKDYPDFIGAKLIYAPPRNVKQSVLDVYFQLARNIKADMPDLLIGFDLVGQEDAGNPLIDFVKQLKAASSEFDYFFHAGETDWYGTSTDENLVDAILLGAKRIGHAYALIKHPILMKEVKERDIGLEVNIISNAVLSLVRDTRNHPLSVLLANNMPVILSSDDPGAWEAEPLTDDFYVAFVGAASKLSDLRLLKQLALNSLEYSALDQTRKTDAFNKFHVKWNRFINDFNCSKY